MVGVEDESCEGDEYQWEKVSLGSHHCSCITLQVGVFEKKKKKKNIDHSSHWKQQRQRTCETTPTWPRRNGKRYCIFAYFWIKPRLGLSYGIITWMGNIA